MLFFFETQNFFFKFFLFFFIIMGIIINGILGGFNKSIGNISGGKSFGKNIIRSKTIPSNPKSSLQSLHRAKFAQTQLFVNALRYNTVIPFLDPFAKRTTGSAILFKQIFNSLDENNDLTLQTKIIPSGKLEGTGHIYGNLATGGQLMIEIDNMYPTGNGLQDDWIEGFAYHKPSKTIWWSQQHADRTFGSTDAYVPVNWLAADMLVYAWLWRGSGKNFLVSESGSGTVTYIS